jgi:hypothetical protein
VCQTVSHFPDPLFPFVDPSLLPPVPNSTEPLDSPLLSLPPPSALPAATAGGCPFPACFSAAAPPSSPRLSSRALRLF